MRATITMLALAVHLGALAAPLPEPVGYVMTLQAPAYLMARDNHTPARTGQAVVDESTLQTGPGGTLGITFEDGTRLALGPQSDVELLDYRFDPAADALALHLYLHRGTLSLAPGRLASLRPDAVTVQTDEGLVAVRDAHLLLKVAP